MPEFAYRDFALKRAVWDKLKMLERIALLENNWNGYGACSISFDTLYHAKRLISMLHIQSEIFPTARGSIQAEYKNENGDTATRKVLAKHFMLFKETCLYITFSLLLKNDTELHTLVKKELSVWLTKGLSADGAIRRKDYMYAFSKAFYDEYQRSHNLEQTLSYMFWQVAADRYPHIVNSAELHALMRIQGLANVYKYIHKTVQGVGL